MESEGFSQLEIQAALDATSRACAVRKDSVLSVRKCLQCGTTTIISGGGAGCHMAMHGADCTNRGRLYNKWEDESGKPASLRSALFEPLASGKRGNGIAWEFVFDASPLKSETEF